MRTWTAGEAGEGFWLNNAPGAAHGNLGSGQHDDAQEAHLELGWTEDLYARKLIQPSVPPPGLSWHTENQSPDAYDHINDFGNVGGYAKTSIGFGVPGFLRGNTDSWIPEKPIRKAPHMPYFGIDPGFVAPLPEEEEEESWWQRVTPWDDSPGVMPEPEEEPGKTFWDRITPGPSKTPGEMFEGIQPSDLIKPFMPVPGLFGEGAEKVVPEVKKAIPTIKGITDLLPLMIIMMISKD